MAEFECVEDGDPELKLKQISSAVNSQDVSHILTTIFKELLSNSSFNTEMIENQVNSKGSDDPYHKRYVSEMQKVSFLLLYFSWLKILHFFYHKSRYLYRNLIYLFIDMKLLDNLKSYIYTSCYLLTFGSSSILAAGCLLYLPLSI